MAKNVVYVPSCHSTNSLAEQLLADNDLFEGTVIITDEQTHGKGRLNKSWESTRGENLTLSVIFKPGFLALEDQFYLNIFSSLAVAKTVTQLGGIVPEIKWPNDILVDGSKISGILVKNILKGKSISSSILGIGLNINQMDFETPGATSLKMIKGTPINLEEAFVCLLENLEKYYLKLRESAFQNLQDEYHRQLYGLNREIMFRSDYKFKGIIKGIDRTGHLIIDVSGEKLFFNLNEIKYISQPL